MRSPRTPGKECFATAVIRLFVPDSVSEAELKEYLDSIGKAERRFKGFTSRKIVELPQDQGRLLVPLLKFSGETSEAAFRNMQQWSESVELAEFLKQAEEIGIVQDADYSYDSVAKVTIGGSKKKVVPLEAPPKWKIGILVWVWVFISALFHGFSGTQKALMDFFQNGPFSMLVLFIVIVPLITYCALPLTLSFPIICRWAHRRLLL